MAHKYLSQLKQTDPLSEQSKQIIKWILLTDEKKQEEALRAYLILPTLDYSPNASAIRLHVAKWLYTYLEKPNAISITEKEWEHIQYNVAHSSRNYLDGINNIDSAIRLSEEEEQFITLKKPGTLGENLVSTLKISKLLPLESLNGFQPIKKKNHKNLSTSRSSISPDDPHFPHALQQFSFFPKPNKDSLTNLFLTLYS